MSAKILIVYELVELNTEYLFIRRNSTFQTADKDAYIETKGMPLK